MTIQDAINEAIARGHDAMERSGAAVQTFACKFDRTKEADLWEAVAMWQLGWASHVVLDDPSDDAPATIAVTLEEDWESGPSEMVAWVRGKLAGN